MPYLEFMKSLRVLKSHSHKHTQNKPHYTLVNHNQRKALAAQQYESDYFFTGLIFTKLTLDQYFFKFSL